MVPTAGTAAAEDGGGHGSQGSPSSVAMAGGGALLFESGVQAEPDAGVPDPPSGISALSWLVSDATTGQVLAAKNAHRQLPPASTLKTLFADTVLPRFSRETTHKVTDADLAGIGAGSSLVGIQVGQTYTVADLWRGVFLASGNDAVHVLAHMNGSVAETVSDMQAKARMLGANDTHVVSPDGYDAEGQVSSAYDLAVFARAGLQNTDFAEYCSTKDADFPGGYDAHGNYVQSFGIQNTNRLLTGAKGVTPYPGLVGVKNGYTTNAGNTLIAAARHNGRTLIATVMNPQSGIQNAVYDEAAKLLDWGFEAAGQTTSVGTLNTVRSAALQDATGSAAEPDRQAGQAEQPRAAGHTGSAGTPAATGRADEAAEAATPRDQPVSPASAKSSTTSATAWYIGGGLAVVAVVSVVVLRRRHSAKAR
ncbi:D-alanyl-D-alanine carboxypeptidase family protein [Actinacidiphila rubida]|uniref:D-alanyl-D-alanine carboxypeptidase family protein n=1 Tax=Actinacidiphila rubida TaxID=310780 RepID=UPI0008498C0A|nr:serine hydrolase [Actinacidiphila rubida]